jgi:hypothetical protein
MPEPGVEETWRPSFVVLIGLDHDAPSDAPPTCRKLGVVEVQAPNHKVSVSSELRDAARRIGGNTVAEIEQTSAPTERPVLYVGTVMTCPWFTEEAAQQSAR